MSSKEQSFWIGFALVMLILLGGSGFFLVKSLGAYNNASKEHGLLAQKKRSLERKSIYPNQENQDEFERRLDDFEAQVDELHDTLKRFQRPLESTLQAKDFPQILADAVVAFREYTRTEKPVSLPDDFYFGMGKYEKGGLPPQAATGILNFQLDAIERLLRVIIENGAEEIYSFDREITPLEEPGGENPELTAQVAKYTVTVSFLTSHDGFRKFLNEVSNDKEFFYIVRVLRVDNEAKEGPPRQAGVGAETEEIEGEGFEQRDARVVFGNEKLRVTAVVDLCRFPDREMTTEVTAR